MYLKLECNDCKGLIIFNSLASGTEGKVPSQSFCRCIDRETSKGKYIKNVVFNCKADFVPQPKVIS